MAAHVDLLPTVLVATAVVLLALNLLLVFLPRRRDQDDQRPGAAPADDGTDGQRGSKVQNHSRRADTSESTLAPGTSVFGYMSARQSDARDKMTYESQAEAITAFCDANRLELIRIIRDVERDHERAAGRQGLRYVIQELVDGTASAVVVAQLRRLGGSTADLAPLLRWFDESGVALVALDVSLDTTEPEGKRTARTLVALGDWERERLSERTRRGLEEAKARGRTGHRPSVNDVPALSERIQAMRAEGMTLQAIADVLNAEGVPTVRGGTKWRPSSVQTAAGYRRPIGGTRPASLPPPT